MSTNIKNMFLVILIIVSLFWKTEQVSPSPLLDSKTGKELSILTHTYYAIQNQKTLRYLIWFGKNGTVDSDPEVSQGQYWHIFEKIDENWYKMSHHFGSHTVKIAKSHEEGYYHIFNKDCFSGEHPNGDADEHGTIKCFVVQKGNMLEFNWRFLKKPELKEIHVQNKTSPKRGLFNLKEFIIIMVAVIILASMVTFVQVRYQVLGRALSKVRVTYSQENDGFTHTSVFPTQGYGKH